MKRAVLLLLALAIVACSRPIDQAVVALNATQTFLTSANITLGELHRRARDRAIERAGSEPEARAAVAEVHQEFAAAWDAYDGARIAWLGAEAATRAAIAAEAAQLEPNEARVRAALAGLVAAYEAFVVATDRLPPPGAPARPGALPAPANAHAPPGAS